MGFALSPDREKELGELITRYPTKRAACLPALWLCQRQNGWVSPEVIEYVAKRLELSTAAVKGVVTFYTMYFEAEVAPNVVWVCRTLSCDLRGAKAVQEHLEQTARVQASASTSADGKFTLLKAECLAACGQAPMVQINDDYHENLTLAEVDEIIDAHASKTVATTSGTGSAEGIPDGGLRAPARPAATGSATAIASAWPKRTACTRKRAARSRDEPAADQGRGQEGRRSAGAAARAFPRA